MGLSSQLRQVTSTTEGERFKKGGSSFSSSKLPNAWSLSKLFWDSQDGSQRHTVVESRVTMFLANRNSFRGSSPWRTSKAFRSFSRKWFKKKTSKLPICWDTKRPIKLVTWKMYHESSQWVVFVKCSALNFCKQSHLQILQSPGSGFRARHALSTLRFRGTQGTWVFF